MTISEISSIFLISPWKFWNELLRFFYLPFARFQFALAGIKWGKNWKIYGLPILQVAKGSKIEIGNNLELRSTKQSNPLCPFHPVLISTRTKTAKIKIGKNFSMTGGCIVAEKKVQIGDRVMVGANCIIVDTDFHPLSSKIRKTKPSAGKSSPVQIGNDVFMGTQALLLKGAEIGNQSVVGARALVSKKFSKNAVLVGNPAKVLKQK